MLRLAVAPATEPVSASEAKAHLRVTGSGDDTYIGALITAARQLAEQKCNRALITQTWDLVLDAWPCDGVVQIPLGGVTAAVKGGNILKGILTGGLIGGVTGGIAGGLGGLTGGAEGGLTGGSIQTVNQPLAGTAYASGSSIGTPTGVTTTSASVTGGAGAGAGKVLTRVSVAPNEPASD